MSVILSMINAASGDSEEKKYYLMNKDNVIAAFIIRGEGELEECVSIQGTECIPMYFGSINAWVSNRSAAKHRKHIQEILNKTGGDTKEGFIKLTHCLSINDTFWVKSSEEHLLWKDVNLYDNEFSEVISKLAFDGNGMYGEQFSTTSPELTTDGAFDKCWVRDKGVIKLMKAGTKGASNAGREPYSEVLASQVFTALLGNDSVKYSLEKFDGVVVSSCELFTNEDKAYLPHSVFLRNVPDVVDLLHEFGDYGCEDKFAGMLIGDGVTFNTDRRYKNFGWIVDPSTMKRVTMAPVFDFNLSMVAYADDKVGFDNLDAYMADRAPVI